MRHSISLFLVTSLLIIGTSCKKEKEDTASPQISGVQLVMTNSMMEAEAGKSIKVQCSVSDDVDLANLFLEVEQVSTGGNWSESRKLELSGTEATINESIKVPSNTNEGTYKFVLRLIDKAGKFASFESDAFTVVNDLKPKIELILHPVKEGETLTLRGTVRDDVDLASVSVVVLIPPGYSGNQEFFNQHIDITGSSDTLWSIEQDGNIKIDFPQFAKGGDYSLTFSATDNDGNFKRVSEKVRI